VPLIERAAAVVDDMEAAGRGARYVVAARELGILELELDIDRVARRRGKADRAMAFQGAAAGTARQPDDLEPVGVEAAVDGETGDPGAVYLVMISERVGADHAGEEGRIDAARKSAAIPIWPVS
jgi:hypothetical protein